MEKVIFNKSINKTLLYFTPSHALESNRKFQRKLLESMGKKLKARITIEIK